MFQGLLFRRALGFFGRFWISFDAGQLPGLQRPTEVRIVTRANVAVCNEAGPDAMIELTCVTQPAGFTRSPARKAQIQIPSPKTKKISSCAGSCLKLEVSKVQVSLTLTSLIFSCRWSVFICGGGWVSWWMGGWVVGWLRFYIEV